MEKHDRIPWELVSLYIQGKLPESKWEEWKTFLEREPEFADQVEEMRKILPQLPRTRRLTSEELQERYTILSSRFSHRKSKRVRIITYIAGIAAVFLVAFFTFQWWKEESFKGGFGMSVDELAVHGRVKAELISSSGEKVILEPDVNLVFQNAVMDSLGLVYSEKGADESTEAYNTLRVPRGGEFRLTLSDGTVVFLNSASELTYPAVFTEDHRTVSLSGEGYFDVTKSNKPFIVKTLRQDIRVLGTQFNVSSYEEEQEEAVVLVSGKVQLQEKDGATYILNSGEKASLALGTTDYQVAKVNTRFYTGWKEGVFYFNRMRLDRIMEQLSRWYDVQIRFIDDETKALHFSGAVKKDKPLSFALEMIKATTAIELDIAKGVIIIRKR